MWKFELNVETRDVDLMCCKVPLYGKYYSFIIKKLKYQLNNKIWWSRNMAPG